MQLQFGEIYQVILCMLASLGAFLIGFKILSEKLQSVAT